MIKRIFFNILKVVVLTIFVAQLNGCATATGPQFSGLTQASADQGDVYLYRTSAIYAIGTAFEVFVDGKKVGDLPNASYIRLRLKPGNHGLMVAPGGMGKKSLRNIDVKSGASMFYQYEFMSGPFANMFFAGSDILELERETALQNLKELRLAKAQ